MTDRGFSAFGKPIIRFENCNRCKYSTSALGNRDRCMCQITKKEGQIIRAETCMHFEYRCKPIDDTIAEDGYKYRSKQGRELLTEKQWSKKGFNVKDGAVPELMHPVIGTEAVCSYYNIEQVERQVFKSEI